MTKVTNKFYCQLVLEGYPDRFCSEDNGCPVKGPSPILIEGQVYHLCRYDPMKHGSLEKVKAKANNLETAVTQVVALA